MSGVYRRIEELPERLVAAVHRFMDDACIVAVTDLRGTIVFANDAFCRISGYSREELLGQNHRILKSGRHPPAFFHEMWQTIARGDIWSGEICNRRRDGSLYWVESTFKPLCDAEGRATHYCALRIDITARKEAQQRLLEAMEQDAGRRRLEAVGRMADGMLHDLNNLLGGALMLADLADTGSTSGETQRAFLMRMAQLIHNVRDFSSGRPVELREVDAAAAIAEACRLAGFSASRQREIAIEVDTSAVERCIVRVNEAQVLEVVLNLFINASEALASVANPGIRVTTSTSSDRSQVYVHVHDNGPGVPEHVVSHLFEAYVSSKGKGRGVGLAAARRLAQQLGGDLALEPSTKGARFCFSLPISRAATIETPVEVRPVSVRSTGVVLLADDDQAFLAGLARTLHEHGFETITAVAADDAIVKAGQFRGCLTAAVLDGVGTVKENALVGFLRSIQPGLSIVLVSGELTGRGVRETQHGPVHILPKPFVAGDLVALLRGPGGGKS